MSETFPSPANMNNGICPTRQVLNAIADKWATLIIALLEKQTMRFAALEKQLEGISQKMLTQNLRSLERDGLVQRTIYAEVPLRVEYALTPLGRTLCEPLAAIINWSEANIGAIMVAQQRYDEQTSSKK